MHPENNSSPKREQAPTILASAVAFARRGHAVLPLTWPVFVNGRRVCSCRRGADCGISSAKHPFGRLVSRGLLDATTDEAIVRKWFAQEEPQANLGVRTDNLIVIDADRRHGGDETLAELEREHKFPPTWRVLTGGGGEHVVFACPDGIAVKSSNADKNPVLGAGLDVRAQGGYIVAPPSRHISGRAYAWSVDHHPADVSLAEAPAWLIERLGASPAGSGKGHPEEWAKHKAERFSEYRDMHLAAVVGKLLRAISIDPAFAITLALDWNECHCDPPLPEREVVAVFNRIAESEIKRLERS